MEMMDMRAVIQRVAHASVSIDGSVKGSIRQGFLVLFGAGEGDTAEDARLLAKKTAGMRIFCDDNGKMNVNPTDAGARFLIISQFTLFADCRSRRPGFSHAARPDKAIPLYELVISECRAKGFEVETGEFGAEMFVESVNDGPVTILLDTKEL